MCGNGRCHCMVGWWVLGGRLNAGSKPKAKHTLQILPKPLSTRSLIPFNRKPNTHKLKLNPKPQNPTTTPQGHITGEGGPHPISGPFTFGGGGGGAAESLTIYKGSMGGSMSYLQGFSVESPLGYSGF